MDIRGIGSFIAIIVGFGLLVSCTNVNDVEQEDIELSFKRIVPAQSKLKGERQDKPNYYCAVSSLANEENEHNYIYDSFVAQFPKRMIKEAKGKRIYFERVFSASESFNLKKAKSYKDYENVTRVGRCIIPDSEEAIELVQEWLSKYGQYTFLSDLSKDRKGKSIDGEFEWVCEEWGQFSYNTCNADMSSCTVNIYWACTRGYWRYLPGESQTGGGGGNPPGGDDPFLECDDITVPCDPGGGGSDLVCPVGQVLGAGNVCIDSQTPCQEADKLENDPIYKSIMMILKANATTKNFETGYIRTVNSDGSYSYTYIQGNPNEPKINISGSGYLEGISHSHNNGTFNMFSVEDLKVIYSLLINNNIRDVNTFTSSLVTSNNNTYLLVIDDLQKFAQFGADHLSSQASIDILENIYTTIGVGVNSSASDSETGFLQLMDQFDVGLAFFKGNTNNFASWDRKILDSNNMVVNGNCN